MKTVIAWVIVFLGLLGLGSRVSRLEREQGGRDALLRHQMRELIELRRVVEELREQVWDDEWQREQLVRDPYSR